MLQTRKHYILLFVFVFIALLIFYGVHTGRCKNVSDCLRKIYTKVVDKSKHGLEKTKDFFKNLFHKK